MVYLLVYLLGFLSGDLARWLFSRKTKGGLCGATISKTKNNADSFNTQSRSDEDEWRIEEQKRMEVRRAIEL